MDELIRELREAFDLLYTVSVSRQDVDTMASARARLRKAYQLAEKLNAEAEVKDG